MNRISPEIAPNQVQPGVSFREVQRPRQWWLWSALTFGTALLAWACFLCQIVVGTPLGSDPAPDWIVLVFWVLFGLAFPLLFLASHLTTEVHSEHLHVTFFPFFRRQLAFADIASCKAVCYQPLAQFGGWGIRVNMDRHWAWSVSGNEGVQLDFRNGRRLLIGSQTAGAFASAVAARRQELAETRSA